ncbi:MAG: SUMF1/EgtB/PvdO family nonheme iron enzyme [Treponema sp.]|jgi:formylglycine-generating enzyme required for sulfatase activity|nr:SUMF1/EgtB/PvdO family nonheme iron enzyme [Treponema sp.]
MRERTPKPADKTPTPEDQVKLSPVLGLRPGIYLAVIYAIVLLLIFFFVLINPGLRNPGSLVMLRTEPAGAALRVDGVYMGTSPDRIFVSRGIHTFELVLPGFETVRIECEIPGWRFASALFPRRYPLELALSTADPFAVFSEAAADYAAWSFGGEPTASWQIPLSLSEGAYRIGTAGGKNTAGEILEASARFAVTRAALRDLLRAKFLADNGGNSPSPLSLTRSAADITGFLSENPNSVTWLADVLPSESSALVIASRWYQKQLAAFAEITAGEVLAPAPGQTPAAGTVPPASQVRVGGLTFTGIAGGTLVQGEPFPYRSPISAFMLCNIQIPPPAYADFLAANPQWRADQLETLIEQGLVTVDYIVDNRNPGIASAQGRAGGITAVSWFAAQAFCEWLSTQLPPSLADYEIPLPTEAEWEYAAKSVKRWGAVSGGPMTLEGGPWEWCVNPYAPLDFITASARAAAAVGSPERSLRGGSLPNSANPVGLETRASLPPAFCSPFVSFRPVIAAKQ